MIWEEVETIARHGDPYSIGLLCNRLLRKQGITVQVSREDHNLTVVLTAKKLPHQRKYVRLLRQELKRFQIEAIATANISGRKTGASGLAWTETIKLKKVAGKPAAPKSSKSTQPQLTKQKPSDSKQSKLVTSPPEPELGDRNPAQIPAIELIELSTKPKASAQAEPKRSRLPQIPLVKVGTGSMVGFISLASFGVGMATERAWQVSDRLLSMPQMVRTLANDRFNSNQSDQSSEPIVSNRKINPGNTNNPNHEGVENSVATTETTESLPNNAIAPTPAQLNQNQDQSAPALALTAPQSDQPAIAPITNSNLVNISEPDLAANELATNQELNFASPETAIDPATQFTWESAQLFMRQSGLLNTPKAPKITIKAVGDMIPGTNYPSFKLPEDREILFAAIAAALSGSDLLFGNFESTLTNHPYAAKDTSRPNVFAFRTPPDYAEQLKQIGFDVLSVANNHSFDFGDVGFLETIANIENAGMAAVGQKGQILYLEVKGNRVAFIGFSYFEDHNSIHDLEAAKALIQTATANSEIVIISVHAGAEGTDAMTVSDRNEYFFGENRGNMLLFSRTMIDAGADLILGHGPHVPRAMELYGDRLIAYSLGNFMGYQTLSSVAELGYSLILELELDQEGRFITGKIIPVHIDANGIPKPDPQNRSIKLIKALTEQDFPDSPLQVTAAGELINQSPEPIANN
ncbi:Capsule synthesis protein, CapA [Thalassoporum mexicanum PCC 7367]|nr:Capsule synthesis protein, CapA [Pseudanabaena sp. PCC 7367]